MEKKTMYMVGHFNEYGNFMLFNSWNAVTPLVEEANKVLKDARLKCFPGQNYEIYKVKPEAFELVEEDVGLKEFTLLKHLVSKEIETSHMSWFTRDIPGFDYEIDIYADWKYNSSKRIATYEFEYRIYRSNCFMGNGGADRLHKVEAKIEEDLKNQCLYRFTPIIKRIMKERGLNHIRVDFRSKYANSKVTKGFIENKGV